MEYVAGVIEARGYKGETVTMTPKREATGSLSRLAVSADRDGISADGEDAGMFVVEVQDAQGRVVRISPSGYNNEEDINALLEALA